jgi:hypothetical protein
MRAFYTITTHFYNAKGEFRTLFLGLPYQAGYHIGFGITLTISAIFKPLDLSEISAGSLVITLQIID